MSKIKFKRGVRTNLPELSYGEPAFVSDERELYIGTEKGNVKLTSKSEIEEINLKLNEFLNHINSFIVANNIDNTGKTDVTNELQELLNNNDTVMLPSGIYKVSKLILNNNNFLYGENRDTVILQGTINDYVIESVDKSYNIKIKSLTINGNHISGGIHFVATNNENMTNFDIKNSIDNLQIRGTKKEAVLLDSSCRECRLNDVSCYYGEHGIIINGTDNFINACTVGNMKYTGFSFKSNNKANLIKAFLCNQTGEDGAIIVDGYGTYITNACCQQNIRSGIIINGNCCNVDTIADSQGFENLYDNASGIIVNGCNNKVTGCIIDGRLKGAMKYGLYVGVGAFFNDINVTFRIVDRKEYDTECIPYFLFLKKSLNNIIFNGECINNTSNIEYKYFYNYNQNNSPRFVTDATGAYSIKDKDIEITLSNFESIKNGYGSTFRIYPQIEDKKYLVVHTIVKGESVDNNNYIRTSIINGISSGPTSKYTLFSKYTNHNLNNEIDLFFVIDIKRQKEELGTSSIWLGLFKDTNDNVSSNAKATFKNTRFYFTD